MLPAAVIGLEVHVQLATESKLFCRCPSRFGAPANSQVCAVCLGYPGTLPVLNRRAVDLAVILAVAVGAEVQERSRFDRKSYFYPDLPKGYQITQYGHPLATGGGLPVGDPPRTVALRRLHLEEDAGRLLHDDRGGDGGSRVDFNRAGVPLVEIVGEPELRSPAEAEEMLRTLHRLLLYTGVSDGSLDEGSLRCDANVSLAETAAGPSGAPVEIKNLNSFRHVARALESEIERQRQVVAGGGTVVRQTRGFDETAGTTYPLRGKEAAADYRFFAEPDLPPLVVDAARVAAARRGLPELPWERFRRFAEQLGLASADAALLTADPRLADYFEAVIAGVAGQEQEVARWLTGDVLAELRRRGHGAADVLDAAPTAAHLAELVSLVADGTLSRRAAKQVLQAVWDDGEAPSSASRRLGLVQVGDADRIAAWVETELARHPELVRRCRAGERRLLGHLMGRVLERSGGQADPLLVRRELERRLGVADATPARRQTTLAGDSR